MRVGNTAYLDQDLLGGLLVDLGLVGNVASAVCIVEGAERLLQVAQGRRDCSDDGRLGSSSQRVLEDTRQLGLPEELRRSSLERI